MIDEHTTCTHCGTVWHVMIVLDTLPVGKAEVCCRHCGTWLWRVEVLP